MKHMLVEEEIGREYKETTVEHQSIDENDAEYRDAQNRGSRNLWDHQLNTSQLCRQNIKRLLNIS